MSRQRRNFSAKFKSNLVIELLKDELNNLGLIEPHFRFIVSHHSGMVEPHCLIIDSYTNIV